MADHVDSPLRVLSICSGIGGLDLGVRRALHSRVVAYVERDPFAASVLMDRMEDEALDPAPLWCGDLRELDARPLAGHIDMVICGFPCPPFSSAGKGLGAKDERDLWPEVARIIRGVGARLVFLENVGGAVRHPDGLGRWLGDLAELGFDAEFSTVRASDVGAPHRRERLFILAYSRERGLESLRSCGLFNGERQPQLESTGSGKQLAHAALMQRDGRDHQPRRKVPEPGDGGSPPADTLPLRGGGNQPLPPWPPGPNGDWSGVPEHLLPALGNPPGERPNLRCEDEGQQPPEMPRERLDRPGGEPEEAEPLFCRVDHAGLGPDLVDLAQLYRTERLRALVNAVVPAQAEHAIRLLLERVRIS